MSRKEQLWGERGDGKLLRTLKNGRMQHRRFHIRAQAKREITRYPRFSATGSRTVHICAILAPALPAGICNKLTALPVGLYY